MRQNQFERGTYKEANKAHQQQTSEQNLRQMIRVSKFLVEYCGGMAVEKIDNAVLADYVPWRRDYYRRMPEAKRPRNHRLDPADKTLEWETTFALTVLKWAHERGYRGQRPLPKFRHKASRAKTRPAYTLEEYRRLYRQMRNWIKATDDEEWRYTRELLRDYVLSGADQRREVPKRIKRWWITNLDGTAQLTIRYGSKALELAKGKSAIECADAGQIAPTLMKVKEAAISGELDLLLNGDFGPKRNNKAPLEKK